MPQLRLRGEGGRVALVRPRAAAEWTFSQRTACLGICADDARGVAEGEPVLLLLRVALSLNRRDELWEERLSVPWEHSSAERVRSLSQTLCQCAGEKNMLPRTIPRWSSSPPTSSMNSRAIIPAASASLPLRPSDATSLGMANWAVRVLLYRCSRSHECLPSLLQQDGE